MTTHPTPYPAINNILSLLLDRVQTVIGDRFIGLYLHGSLAYGDFNPHTSDIDFLVVTNDPLSEDVFIPLKEMHTGLFSSGLPWSQKLEGAYIPKNDLRRYDPIHVPIPWLGMDGHFALESLGSDWIIQRWILREKGLVISGPPLRDMIEPVSEDDLREAVRGSLREWWSPPFPSPDRFQRGEYQAYAVLTMCRSLYLLEYGRVASKPEAARWAKAVLGGTWGKLIDSSTKRRKLWNPNLTEEVFAFIRFTLGKWGINPGHN